MYQSTHTGAQVDEAVDKVLASPISVISNRNILDNWFFANPVNQRGRTSYSTNNAYCIDRWKYYGAIPMTLESGGIRLGDTTSNVVTYVRQFIEMPQQYAGKTLTYSILVKDLSGTGNKGFIRWYTNDGEKTNSIINGELTTLTLTVPTSLSLLFFDIGSYWNNAFTAVSVKLEIGSVSTLANDTPPDYGEELTRCIYSTADPSDTYANTGFGFARANRNVLDNWYFVNPVNQRGKTAYTGGYSIDRWKLLNNSGTLNIVSGGIQFTNTTGGYGYCTQKIENVNFSTTPCTFSVLTSTGDLYTGRVAPQMFSLPSGLYFYRGGTSEFAIRIPTNLAAENSEIIVAMKIEIGTIQTLAHQENGVWVLNEIPNYAEELAKCQRYYWEMKASAAYALLALGMGTASNIASFKIQHPVTMRDSASVTASGTFGCNSASFASATFRNNSGAKTTNYSVIEFDTTISQGTATTLQDFGSNNAKLVFSAEL